MSRALVAASIVLSLGAASLAGWALVEVAALRKETASSRARAGAPVPDATRRIEEVETRVRRLETNRSGLPGDAPSADAPGIAAAAADPDAREPLRVLLRDLLREEREAAAAAGTGERAKPDAAASERKPPLSQFAAELDLDPSQRESVHRTVLQGQERMISLLRTPTAGGRVPIDDLLDAILGKPEEARPKMIEIFGLLASEKVPGTDRTYAEGMETFKSEAVDAFRREFSAEQFKAFEKSGQDPLEIQVSDSPWIPVFQDAMLRRK